MSLSAHDRHALDLIEEGLAGSDPRFAAKLAAFSRLAEGEDMPARERIRWDRPRGAGPTLFGPRPRSRARPRRSRYLIILAVWLSISLAMISIAVVLSHAGPTSACARRQGIICVTRAVPSSPPVPAGHQGGGRSPRR